MCQHSFLIASQFVTEIVQTLKYVSILYVNPAGVEILTTLQLKLL